MKVSTNISRIALAGLIAGLAGSALGQEEPGRGGLLAALDRNQDGKLDQTEIDLAVASLRKLDRNNDGELDRAEIGGSPRGPGRPGAPGQDGTPRRPRLPDFSQFDKNGDGKISKAEAPERMLPRFDQMDANGDGFFDKEEQEEFLKRIRDRVREGGQQRPGRPADRPDRPNRPDRDEGQGGTDKPQRPAPKDE